MQLNKSDAETEMPINMTPMIDVVFLLIIFFMIITDLSQQDLEEIKLPVAMTAVPDEPDPTKVRPIVNINAAGEMIVKGEMVYDPELDDLRELEGYLSNQSRAMPKKGFDPDLPISSTNPGIPDNPLLIRADENTAFKYVQRIMTICGKKGIEIWKIEIAAAEPPEGTDKTQP